MLRKTVAVVLLAIALFFPSRLVKAQTETPPTPSAPSVPTGVVTGKIVNRSQGGKVPEKAELMVHVWDQTADKGMYHGTSQPDGTFQIDKIPFLPGNNYLIMAVYNDVTYYSETKVLESGDTLNFDVPVYETTTDLSQVKVDQLHIIFDESADGLEVREVYILSNLGDRTVKDATKLDDGSPATLKVPLPTDADYIFFKPDNEQDRFVKFPGGMADKSPLLPGPQTGQFMVSYLLPYKGQKDFSYTAPFNIDRANLLIPADKGLTLSGAGLGEPDIKPINQGQTPYKIYSLSGLEIGKSINISISGTANGNASNPLSAISSKFGIATGLGFLGLVMVVIGGVWAYQVKKQEADDNEEDSLDDDNSDDELERLIAAIARLDETHEKGEISPEEYKAERSSLMQQAKARMTENNRE